MDDSPNELALLRKMLDQCKEELAKALIVLYNCEQREKLLEGTLKEREEFIIKQQAQIKDLQSRNDALNARLAELEHRAAIDPAGLGAALGKAVDAIQQNLTGLQNPFVDYALQEFDLQAQVNLQIDDNGRLLIRFPGLNEQVPFQNLNQLQMRLRPIPKSQEIGLEETH